MNYIYDITLNFNSNLYDFYEWNVKDNIDFILKIPIFKIDKETFENIKYNVVTVSNDFLLKIKNKTETYSPNILKIIKYSAIFVTDEECVAIKFDDNGTNYMKSVLSLDEEEDVFELSKSYKFTIIDYKVNEIKACINNFCTRNENSISSYLEIAINNIYKKNDYEKLKYIYYEMFDSKSEDINKIYFSLLNIINSKNNKMYILKDLLNILNSKKIMNKNS